MSRKLIISIIIVVLVAAVATTTLLVSKSANSLEHQLELGNKYLKDGDYEEAILAFERAIEIDERNVDAYMGLAEAYIEIDDIEEAIDALEDVIDIDDEYEDAYIQLAELLIEEGDIEEAIEIIQIGIENTDSEELMALLDSLRPEAPVANYTSGTYIGPIIVELTAPNNTNIYYTLDGEVPSIESSRYVAGINVEVDTILSFVCISDEGISGVVEVCEYNISEVVNNEEDVSLGRSLVGFYEEDVQYPCSISFYDDDTFEFSVNLYEGFGICVGSYQIVGDYIECTVTSRNFSGFIGDNVNEFIWEILDDATLIYQGGTIGTCYNGIQFF